MEEFIIGLMKDILEGASALTDDGNNLLKSPQAFNTGLYNSINSIMKNAVMPVAYILLGLLFMVELYNVTIRTEGMYNHGFEIPFKVMFKIIICKLAVDSTPLIMGAIYEISEMIMNNIANVFNSQAVILSLDMDTVKEQIEDMGFTLKLLTAIQVLIVWLVYKFAYIIMLIIIVGRMIEIYVYLAISPLPIATFPNSETSGIAKNFLKSFAAVCIQGVLLFIILAMYGGLVSSIVSSFDNSPKFMDVLFQATLFSLVLVVALFATSRWSKSMMNAI